MKKIIIISAVIALFSASIAYAATKALVVDSTQIYLKDSTTQQTITSFVDGQNKCYILQVPNSVVGVVASISCVKM